MKQVKKIAVLITCHNRKANTLACLGALLKNNLPVGYSIDVFLVDDGSTDGTELSVRKEFPKVRIITGDGNLYWNGGMHLAFSSAIELGFDYYLWLNDDTVLNQDSLSILIDCYTLQRELYECDGIVVGSVQDPLSGELTYGGVKRQRRLFNQIKMKRILSLNGRVQEADTMNGNCVFIPSTVVDSLGNIDDVFVHALGDFDYGLRAKAAGINIWVAPYAVGLCTRDHISADVYQDEALSMREQIRKVLSPKGLPLKSWMIYCRRHAGVMWPFIWLRPYVKIIITGCLRQLKAR